MRQNLFDIIGPVMIGPSSSHSAGAQRLGLIARAILGRDPESAEFLLHGSFAATGIGHGTPQAMMAGVLGLALDAPEVKNSLAAAKARGIQFSFRPADLGVNHHPNTARIILKQGGETLDLLGYSVGGGRIEVRELDGFKVHYGADAPALFIYHRDEPGVIAAVSSALSSLSINIATFASEREEKHGPALMQIEVDADVPAAALAELGRLTGVTRTRYLPGF